MTWNTGIGKEIAAKAGLVAWSVDLARRIGERGATANVVAPGLILNTEFFSDALTEQRRTMRRAQTSTSAVDRSWDDNRVTRIVAGVAGGRRLRVPPRGTRPTSERVREALFSAVEAAIELDGARVLDLYAGSGALGLEALSRGAAAATFVEADRGAISVLEKNIAVVGLPGAELRKGRVSTVLEAGGAPHDLVLADPPYDLDGSDLTVVLAALVEHGWTRPGSVVVVERARRSGEPGWPEPLVPERVRRYGDTELHWARHAAPEG